MTLELDKIVATPGLLYRFWEFKLGPSHLHGKGFPTEPSRAPVFDYFQQIFLPGSTLFFSHWAGDGTQGLAHVEQVEFRPQSFKQTVLKNRQ